MRKYDVQITIAASIYKDDDEDTADLLASTFAFPLPHLLNVEILEITDGQARQEETSQTATQEPTATTTKRIK